MPNQPNGIFKTTNDYQKLIDPTLYEKTPKAGFAAIVVSFLLNFKGINSAAVDSEIIAEWQTLNANNIIPQKAPK